MLIGIEQSPDDSYLSISRLAFRKINPIFVVLVFLCLCSTHALGTLWCFVYHLESRHRLSTPIAPPYKFSTSFSSNNAMAVAVDSNIDHSYEIKDVSERTSSGV